MIKALMAVVVSAITVIGMCGAKDIKSAMTIAAGILVYFLVINLHD